MNNADQQLDIRFLPRLILFCRAKAPYLVTRFMVSRCVCVCQYYDLCGETLIAVVIFSAACVYKEWKAMHCVKRVWFFTVRFSGLYCRSVSNRSRLLKGKVVRKVL